MLERVNDAVCAVARADEQNAYAVPVGAAGLWDTIAAAFRAGAVATVRIQDTDLEITGDLDTVMLHGSTLREDAAAGKGTREPVREVHSENDLGVRLPAES